MNEFKEFEEKIRVNFNNKDLLKQALTHRSYLNENRGKGIKHNERLEFLGDAVLELVITEFLYHKYPNKPEGEMTAIRAALVNTKTISNAALELEAGNFLLLSKGEKRDTGRARQFILANTFESIIGAIYLDQGYGEAKKFIDTNLFHLTKKIVEDRLWHDSKSKFQESAQEYENITPTYKVIKEEGLDHDKHFTISVFLDASEIASGEGESKQEAEQEAAKKALQIKKWD